MKTTTHHIATGDAGVRQTIGYMALLAREGLQDARVVVQARAIALQASQRDERAIAEQIAVWLRSVWHFTPDPTVEEFLVSPGALLSLLAQYGRIPGDCDEAAILGASLGMAVGLDAHFVVLGFASPDPEDHGRLSHVYAELLTPDGERVSLDVTRPDGALADVARQWIIPVTP